MGALSAAWVTGDDAYGQEPTFREAVAAAGFCYVLEVPGHLTVWPLKPTWEQCPDVGFGRPPKPRPVKAERQEVRQRQVALSETAWQTITVAEGAQGPRRYRFAFERVRVTRDRQPGEELWLIHKQNLDGTEPRTFFSNAPVDTPLPTLARVAMSRWRAPSGHETEFEDEKSLVALDEYEVRRWSGWHHHITLCLLASAFLLTLQQDWGEKDAPANAAPGAPDRLRTLTAKALDPRRVTRMGVPDPTAERSCQAQSCPTASPRVC